MATVGVYDFDYMNYEHVIPNLECAKLCTYFHNRHDIAVLAPRLEPERYTNFFVRKEYDEGWFPRKIFAENCEYGGRAFNPDKYSSLESKIERTIPNMHLYDRYLDKFGPTQSDTQQIKRILNCAHVRLELNEKPLTLNQLLQIMNTGKYTGIIFHDYDLARIKEAYDIIYDISSTRHFIGKKGLNPYPIGNKFPIMVNSSEELQEWLKITTIPGLFFLQYNGLMDNEVLYNLCVDNTHTFTVGNSGIVVHNACVWPNKKYAGKTYYFPEGSPQALKYPNGVPFTEAGYPDFSQYAIKTATFEYPSSTAIANKTCLLGNCSSDFTMANTQVGLSSTPTGYVWHHVEDCQTMLLVPQDLHNVAMGGVAHRGGEAEIAKVLTEIITN